MRGRGCSVFATYRTELEEHRFCGQGGTEAKSCRGVVFFGSVCVCVCCWTWLQVHTHAEGLSQQPFPLAILLHLESSSELSQGAHSQITNPLILWDQWGSVQGVLYLPSAESSCRQQEVPRVL